MRIKLLRLFPAALLAALLLCVQSAPLAQGEEGAAHHGTLSTSYGENTIGPEIYDSDLRKLIDECIPEYHSALFVFTQCYGGDMVDDFADMERTAILSATQPGQKAYYGGYETGAGNALAPAAGKTSNDVHSAGVAAKDPRENPNANGTPVSLEPANPGGPIKSRHYVFYAGQPDARPGRDVDQRNSMKAALGSLPNTTFTSIGGNPAGETDNGTDGWDFAGHLDGLKAALAQIKPQMNADEQFIFFVSDHGGLQKSFNDFEWGTSGKIELTLNLSAGLAGDMLLEENFNDYAGITIDLEPEVALEQELQAGDLEVEMSDSGAENSEPAVQEVTYGQGGAPHPDDHFRLFFPFTSAELLPYDPENLPLDENDRLPVSFLLSNNLGFPLQVATAGVNSGPVPRPQGPDDGGAGTAGSEPGPNPPDSALSATPGLSNLPVLQSLFRPPDGGMDVLAVELEISGDGDAELIDGISIFDDANGNGQVDSGETELASSSGVPILKDIPILMQFFQHRQVEEESELIILVTASLVENRDDSSVSMAGIAGAPLIGLFVCLGLGLAALTLRRKWRRLALGAGILAVAAAALALLACGGGTANPNPNPNPNPDPQPEQHSWTFTLNDVVAANLADGTQTQFDGLPQEGSTVSATF